MKSNQNITSNNNKLLHNASAILIVLITATLLSCNSSQQTQAVAPPPPALPVKVVHADSAKTFTTYPASIQGATDIEIRPQVSGYLQAVLVNEGAYVKAGQTLFKISENSYRQTFDNSRASLHAAEAAVMNTQIEIDKMRPLVQNNVVSTIQLKSAEAAHKIALANVEQAKANVASAKINLGYTNVKATLSGYIGRIPKKQGSLVSITDQTALTTLSDIQKVHVYFSLAEEDFNTFNQIYPGKTPLERMKNLPLVELMQSDDALYPTKGKIDMIDGQFDKSTGAIMLRASFANTDGRLRSGNTGKIRMMLSHKNVISIPQSATIEMQDKVFVFTVDQQNKVSKHPITIAGKTNQNYLVSAGIKSGSSIVLSGLDHLQEGQLIKPQHGNENSAKLVPNHKF